ncbi:hypothetical protein KDI_22120 [Dictyobacter arantiisoli]|uniref:Uncharacterized protein n=1 Tax=Dictyobacter arantiisoli TaxID=2014874 RepID=A0A5A5TB70_9CHLR|nr:hypothetical protein KDI_22120 [Dictyobacter arantiisoli]
MAWGERVVRCLRFSDRNKDEVEGEDDDRYLCSGTILYNVCVSIDMDLFVKCFYRDRWDGQCIL